MLGSTWHAAVQELPEADYPERFRLSGDAPVAKPDPPAADAGVTGQEGRPGKRKADGGPADEAPAAKKHKEDDAGVIDLDSDSDAADPSASADVITID